MLHIIMMTTAAQHDYSDLQHLLMTRDNSHSSPIMYSQAPTSVNRSESVAVQKFTNLVHLLKWDSLYEVSIEPFHQKLITKQSRWRA